MTDRRRAVFLGSGAFAVPVLDALASAPACVLVGVVTAPLRPVGRRGVPSPTPVDARAQALGIATLRPERLRTADALAAVRDLAPEVLVLADYGRIVPPALLELPALGALNLHPSLLPRHRGASPIPAAILAGDTETGVTLMLMDAGIDTGPVVAQMRTPIGDAETAPELETRLADLAADLLARTLEPWLEGALPARSQPEAGATLTRPLRRDDGRIDPGAAAVTLARMVRAYQPWPGTWFEAGGERFVIWAAQALDGDGAPSGEGGAGPAGGGIVADGDGLAISVVDGRLRLLEVQPAGGRRMSGAELRRGRPGLVGSRLTGASLA